MSTGYKSTVLLAPLGLVVCIFRRAAELVWSFAGFSNKTAHGAGPQYKSTHLRPLRALAVCIFRRAPAPVGTFALIRGCGRIPIRCPQAPPAPAAPVLEGGVEPKRVRREWVKTQGAGVVTGRGRPAPHSRGYPDISASFRSARTPGRPDRVI